MIDNKIQTRHSLITNNESLESYSSDIANVKSFGATGDGITDDTQAIQDAVNSGASVIYIPSGTYIVSTIIIQPHISRVYGAGFNSAGTVIKHKNGDPGSILQWNGKDRIIGIFLSDFYILGNSEENETYGLELSGFSYSTFQNIYIRLMKLDGVYVDGSVFTVPYNQQFSNNTFINIRSNNNLRDGFRFEGSEEANSANIYIGCEGAGNGNIGFNELVGYSNETRGCIFQGNRTKDLYTDGVQNVHSFYAEGINKAVSLGNKSFGNNISCRSSYPLWNTFNNEGRNNTISVRGELQKTNHLFTNPYFKWISLSPTNVLTNGSIQLESYVDVNSPVGYGVLANVNQNFQGLQFILTTEKEYIKSRWVTLIVEINTNDVIDNLETRVAARFGSTANGANGTFVSDKLKNKGDSYFRLYYDVKFPDTISDGSPNLIWYIAYSGVTQNNILKIRSVHVVEGQTAAFENYIENTSYEVVNTTLLSNISNGINVHRKSAGKIVYVSNEGRIRYANSTLPSSPWKSIDGSADIYPV